MKDQEREGNREDGLKKKKKLRGHGGKLKEPPQESRKK